MREPVARRAGRKSTANRSRSVASSVILTDEVRWPQGRNNRLHAGKAAHSVIQITDQMPEGAGKAPPAGYFYNKEGALQNDGQQWNMWHSSST